jgi:hypothetical protein
MKRDWFHTDQSYKDSSFKCIQSFINEGYATLSILESSHKYHKKFNDIYQINDKKKIGLNLMKNN